MSAQLTPASARASLLAWAPMVMPVTAGSCRRNGCRPTPTMATSVRSPLMASLRRLERVADHRRAVRACPQRQQRQPHRHADLEPGRIADQPRLDDHVAQVHVADAVRRKAALRHAVGGLGLERLHGPGPQGAMVRELHRGQVGPGALRAARLGRERHRAAARAAGPGQPRRVERGEQRRVHGGRGHPGVSFAPPVERCQRGGSPPSMARRRWLIARRPIAQRCTSDGPS